MESFADDSLLFGREQSDEMAGRVARLARRFRIDAVLIALLLTTIVWQRHAEETVLARRAAVKPEPSSSKHSESIWYGRAALVSGEVLENVEHPEGGTARYLLETGDGRRFLVKAPSLPWRPGYAIRKGDRLTFEGKFLCTDDPAKEEYLIKRGALCYLIVQTIFEHRRVGPLAGGGLQDFAARLQQTHGNRDALAVLIATTLGLRDLLGEVVETVFRNTGTSHLLVISGFHVGLVYALFFRSFRKAAGLSSRLVQLVPLDIPAAWAALIFAGWYTWLCGGALPAVRAMLILAVFAAGRVVGRRTCAGRNLLLALLLVQLIWPGSIFEPGCQLTFAALAGLWAVAPMIESSDEKAAGGPRVRKPPRSYLQKAVGALRRYFRSSLIAAFGAWAGTTPIVLWWFQQIVPLSVVFNIVFVAPYSFIYIVGGGMALGAVWLELPGSDAVMRWVIFCGEAMLTALYRGETLADELALGAIPFSEKAARAFALPLGILAAASILICRLLSASIRRAEAF